MRRADDAWAIQMERDPKKRKTLVLIGIVCDDEIKDFINLKAPNDRSKVVRSISDETGFSFLGLLSHLIRKSKYPRANAINYP